MVRRLVMVAVTVAMVGGASSVARSVPAAVPLPNSMAAIGDSITRAFDVCCFYGEWPQHAWATGDDGTDIVTSHYEQVLAQNPGISGNAFNDAVTGAVMADAIGQAQAAVSQGVDYVTILMGANDLCTDSTSTMTPVATYRSEFQQVMATLTAGLPDAHIFVSSIPNVYGLWAILHNNPTAQFVWSLAQICQSLLSPLNTQQDRRKVLQRNRAFNSALQAVCGHYANCRFDGGAVFDVRFTASMVSTLDYFHPSLSGQAALADATWAASWWSGAR